MAAAVAANRQLSVAQAGVSDEEMQGEVEVEVTAAAATKKKKRKRKGKITALLPPEIANDKTLMKYWYKRFSLFQLFDQGIRMDRGEEKTNAVKYSPTVIVTELNFTCCLFQRAGSPSLPRRWRPTQQNAAAVT